MDNGHTKSYKEKKMIEEVVFVDFENICSLDSVEIKQKSKIVIFVGVKQNKKALEVAQKSIEMASSIELIKVKSQGHNAMDFFIAYYLGTYIERNSKLKYFICSNDQGYEPLIQHLSENGILIKRIGITKEEKPTVEKPKEGKLKKEKQIKEPTDSNYQKALANIIKSPTTNRPRKRERLIAHLLTALGKNITVEEVSEIVEQLVSNKIISIDKEKVIYVK